MLTGKMSWIVLLGIIFTIVGCSKVHKRVAISKPHTVLLNEARLTDVSLPVGVSAYDVTDAQEDHKDQLVVRYQTSFAVPALIDFYQLDMERLGWRQQAMFTSTEGVTLLFERPTKTCIVQVLAEVSHEREVTLFIGNRSS
jgi:hypothetical protein